MRVNWAERAILDLEEIRQFIEGDDAAMAMRIVLGLIKRTKKLRRLPGLGRPGRVLGTRELVVAPWIIAYRVSGAELWVLRVLHGAQKWPVKFSAKRRV